MYRKTVVQFRPAKYTRLSEELLHQLFPLSLLYTSAQQKIWLCKTCDSALKRGNMPTQAKANNLVLEPIPIELRDLNSMEIRLISLRIPFMKMMALPCGKQKAIHGPAVNVPTDLHPVCDLLPRLPSQAQIVPMKLKRRLCYKGHYMYEYVRPDKVLAALEWLKNNNPFYKDVNIDQQWVGNAALDDSELWEAISSQQSGQQAISTDVEQLTSQHPVQQQSTQDATSLDDSELWEAISSQQSGQQAISTDVEQLTSQHPVQQQSTQDATSTCVKQLTAPRPVQQQLTQDATSTHVEQVTAPHLVQHQSTQDATSTRQVSCPVQHQSTQVATSKDDEQVTSPCPVQHQSLQQFHQTTTPTTTSNSKHNISISSSSGSLFSRLNSLASERGFSVTNVPGDGSCLFHSVRMQLETLGIHLQARAMREQLAQYLQEHPYTHDGSCHLRAFLSDSVTSTGDMESAEEEDHFISSIADDDTR